MGFEEFFEALDERSLSLVVLNRTEPEPFQRMVENAFAGQPVGVDEADVPDEDDDVVALVEDAGGDREVVATSPLDALTETILLVNSDLYRSGAVGLDEFELPDVLARLDDVPFRLRGYPESNSEKLLLVVISRYVERRAWRAGRGTLRSSFQRLSRIDDERGTREVYETMGESGVETHVYGVPDWEPPAEFGVTPHGGYTDDYRDSWFVVYTPPDDGGTDVAMADPHVALLALEVEPREWKGFWTFRPSLVASIDEYIAENL